MKKYVLLLIAFFTFIENNAQQPDNFRNSPLYWKNKKPFEGYWQQDVQYTIQASLDDGTDIISGNESLVYTNNSPDTLEFIYFHLYQNAFQPGSNFDALLKANGEKPRYGKYESQKNNIEIISLTANNETLRTEINNTIMKVWLKSKLPPNTSTTFNIDFKTYYDKGSVRRRMKYFSVWGYKHYNGAQWFPKMANYDRKSGWNIDQHLNHEFYGDYGTFDVSLTFPEEYIVDATGILINQSEVLPDTLLEKINLKNFKDKPWNEPPSLIILPDPSKTKTWKFKAEHVHDFAFMADPTFRRDVVKWNNIECIAWVQESHASGWQNAAEYAAKCIQILSENFGMYEYPKIIVADAGDGMEYPMLTMDGGSEPGYRSLFMHEIAHQWFYAMVGNNETYRPMLDEGFAQFLTAYGYQKAEGDYDSLKLKSANWYQKKYKELTTIPDEYVFSFYLSDAMRGDDGFINTHSDMFNGATGHGGGYRQVYRKTGAMLYNLQYVLGDSLFMAAMKSYVAQWKFCHPYVEDFRNSFTHFCKTDLNWFFDQWIETDKRIDYKIGRISKTRKEDEFIIRIKRLGRMQMPVDLTVSSKDGKSYNYLIPNKDFAKKTSATILPEWTGWDKLNPVYKARVKIPTGIDDVRIDTSNILADVNMLNNSKRFPARLRFDSQLIQPNDRYYYVINARPDVWYNYYDGIKAGVHIDGDYFGYSHKIDFNFWLNTGIAQQFDDAPSLQTKYDIASYTFSYTTPLNDFIKNSEINFRSRMLDGFFHSGIGFNVSNRKKDVITTLRFDVMTRSDVADLIYPYYTQEWDAGRYDNRMSVETKYSYSFSSGNGEMLASLSSSGIASDYNYQQAKLSFIDHYAIGKFDLHTRLFFQYGTGSNINSANALFVAGSNPLELMNDKFTRSQGFIPEGWTTLGNVTNHFHDGGGLNLRGYAGYFITEKIGNETRFIYKGNSGASVNLELSLKRLVRIAPRFTAKWLAMDVYLFGDAGSINSNLSNEKLKLSALRADAGAGITMTIKKFGVFQKLKPFTVRADFPMFLSRPPAEEPDFLKFRWVAGIGRTF